MWSYYSTRDSSTVAQTSGSASMVVTNVSYGGATKGTTFIETVTADWYSRQITAESGSTGSTNLTTASSGAGTINHYSTGTGFHGADTNILSAGATTSAVSTLSSYSSYGYTRNTTTATDASAQTLLTSGISNYTRVTMTVGSTTISGVNVTTVTGATTSDSFASTATYYTITGTQTTSTTSSGNSSDSITTATLSTTFAQSPVTVTISTTYTVTKNFTGSVTTTTTSRSFGFPVSTGGTTTTSSSSESVGTLRTSTYTSTGTSSSTFTYTNPLGQYPPVLDKVYVAEYSDWLWSVTVAGTGDVSAQAASFSALTVSNTITGEPTSSATFTITSHNISWFSTNVSGTSATTWSSISTSTDSGTTFSYTVPNGNATFAGSSTTTSLSTYLWGGNTSTATTTPIGGVATGSISYTTTISKTYNYNVPDTSQLTYAYSLNASATSASTVFGTLTTSAGSSTSSFSASWTIPVSITITTVLDALLEVYSTMQRNSTSTSILEYYTGNITYSSYETDYRFTSQTHKVLGVNSSNYSVSQQADSVSATSAVSRDEAALGPGFQAWPNLGAGQPMGTDINAGAVSKFDYAYSSKAVTPEQSVAAIAGSVPTSLKTQKTASRAGGFPFDTSADLTLSCRDGAHRLTTVDSTGGSGTTTTFWPSSTTCTFSPGIAVAMETVPQVYPSTSTAQTFLTFSAFPIT
jgi:hypothetical protein